MKCNVDYEELQKLADRIEKMSKQKEVDALCSAIANEIASRLLRKVIKRTPVGKSQYVDLLVWKKTSKGTKVVKNKDGTPKIKPKKVYTGGTLKGAWDVSGISKKLNLIEVEVYNNIFYASYVEYGHRQTSGRYVPAIGKKLKSSWVDGKFMMTVSVQEIKQSANSIVEKRLNEYLRGVFNA